MSYLKGLQTASSIRREAERLFAARGYAAVSMRDIAEAVGIRVGGLYNHFATKQDILRDLLVRHMEELLAAWAQADPSGTSAEARLTAFARFHIRYHFERPDAVFIAYMELRNLEPANFAVVEGLRRSYEGRLRAILFEGRGLFKVEDEAVATRALIAMLTGVTTWFRPGGRLSITDIETIYVDMARRSVGLPALSDAGKTVREDSAHV
ncbi:TetR/AcrR family transcriptional regulator [Aureimonas altamirensis]|uniref:TetR/AcrR family transcriptional regulator n=1 Tax=Aureimonas altamirensis TaxID=370622 RepID=UPI000A7E0475|nr:TetR/AcrR family transcriptional regulator [Aureimonas altamirensis]